jgi:hypothetical protein
VAGDFECDVKLIPSLNLIVSKNTRGLPHVCTQTLSHAHVRDVVGDSEYHVESISSANEKSPGSLRCNPCAISRVLDQSSFASRLPGRDRGIHVLSFGRTGLMCSAVPLAMCGVIFDLLSVACTRLALIWLL